MGVINYIEFGGVKSSDYGIYVSGEGTFNAPERDVELIEIPGRNGDFSLDKGRFKNITVTYPAFNYETNLTDFRTRLSDFRNALKSKIGYQRLEDTFHPDEYRMATFVDMIDVKPVMYNTASTFDIAFDCKPQRFLKSGEEEIDPSEWGETETKTGEIVSFEAESNTGIKSLVVGIEPNQSGSGDPSPDNIRPISGWDSVNVTECGKNLINSTITSQTVNGITVTVNNGVVTLNGTATAQVALVVGTAQLLEGQNYIFSGMPSTSASNKYFLNLVPSPSTGSSDANYYAPSNITPISNLTETVRIYVRNGQTVNNLVFEPMIRLATETDSTYTPYNGQSHSISLPSTVYGGTLDVTTGVLTIEYKYRQVTSFSGAFGAVTNGYCVYFTDSQTTNIDSVIRASAMKSNVFKYYNGTRANAPLYSYGGPNGGESTQVFILPNTITSVAEANTWLANLSEPLYATFKLATPTTVQLTPEQIETILGVNNIWADSGEVSVEFGADPNILVNPTPFESQPLLKADGYGAIYIEGQNIAVSGEPLGRVNLVNPGTLQSRIVYCTFTEGNAAKLNTGDTITLAASSVSTRFDISAEWLPRFHIDSITQRSGGNQNITAELSIIGDGTGYYIALKLPSMTFQYGTEFEYYYTCNIEIFETTDDVQTNHVGSFYCRVNYDGAREIKTQFGGMSYWTNRGEYAHTISIGATTAESTKLVGNNIYIDLDLGEAYKIVDGAISSYNNSVSLPAKLPILKPGANTITYDNTITSLKVTPRWWKI